MSEFNWTCPHCSKVQTVTNSKRHNSLHNVDVGDAKPNAICLQVYAIGCANLECKKITLQVSTYTNSQTNSNLRAIAGELVTRHKLWPESSHKPQPDYIPAVIVQDYIEACRIRDLSPKASATLARRCIQGVIRDFCKISKSRLLDEIDSLRKQVDEGKAPSGVTVESVDAIDHVRQIGNIGAHMEKDINVILEVDPDEAQALIELIELLFEEWYVARNARQARLVKVQKIGAAKAELKKSVENKQGD